MENLSKKQYSQNLKEIRLERGLTQEQLSKILNTPRTVITMYENCSRLPSFKKHQDICSALDIDLKDFPYFNNDLEALQSQLTAKDKEIEELKAENEELKNKLSGHLKYIYKACKEQGAMLHINLWVMIEQKAEEIKQLKADLEEKGQQFAFECGVVEELKAENEELNRVIDNLESECMKLLTLHRKIDKYEQALEEITKPCNSCSGNCINNEVGNCDLYLAKQALARLDGEK